MLNSGLFLLQFRTNATTMRSQVNADFAGRRLIQDTRELKERTIDRQGWPFPAND
jgi:hypothetical protein